MRKCTICGNTLADSEYCCQNCSALSCSVCGQMYPAGNVMCITDTVLLSGVVLQGPYEADRYEIVELVHRGGMSNIYRAKLLRFGGWLCAIKEMLPPVVGRGERGKGPITSRQEEMRRSFEEAQQLFAKEAAILRQLDHPNIPRIYDFFEQFGKYYLAMEFIEGSSLHDIAHQSPTPLPAERVVQWGIQVCDILSYLHQQRPLPIVHRDIKPDNLILAGDEQGGEKIVLVDFGIARAHKGRKTSDTLRAATIAFAAPEQKGELRVESSPQTDIYELGTTLYFLLTNCGTGSLSYLAVTERGVMGLPHPNIPPQMEHVIRKATAWSPRDRFGSAEEMREALEGKVEAPETPAKERLRVAVSSLWATVRRMNVLVLSGVIAGIILCVVVGGAWLLWGPTTPTPKPVAVADMDLKLRTSLFASDLFTSDRDGEREVYRLTGAGEVARVTYTPGGGESWSPALAPDGAILFTSDRDGKREVYRLTGAGEVARVTYTPGDGESWSPALAPGGTILFTSDRDGKREVYRLSGVGEVERVTYTPGGGESWSPASASGGAILFTSNRDGKREVYRLTGAGGVARVTHTPGDGESWSPALAPDGAILFTSDRDGKREVYRLTGAGEVARITHTPGGGESWSPVLEPGGTILFTSDRDGKWEVYRLAGTGEVIRVTYTPGDGESWSPAW